MRSAIIVGAEHGKKTLSLLSGPEIPIQDQLLKFKEFQRSPIHEKFGEVQLWDSGQGVTKKLRLQSPADAKKSEEARKHRDAEIKTHQASQTKSDSAAADKLAKAAEAQHKAAVAAASAQTIAAVKAIKGQDADRHKIIASEHKTK